MLLQHRMRRAPAGRASLPRLHCGPAAPVVRGFGANKTGRAAALPVCGRSVRLFVSQGLDGVQLGRIPRRPYPKEQPGRQRHRQRDDHR